MSSIVRILSIAPALLAVAHAQGVILSAQGTKGSVASLGLQVQTTGNDANIINLQEINTNVVNECGRTLLAGNIDIGENTENQLLNKTVTSVTKGSTVAVSIDQVSADGAGPYTCDLDPTGNAEGATGQIPLNVTENDAASGKIALTLTMPSDLACIGASAGNVCTVRCFNSAAAGPFGGCFAVQQSDTTPSANQAATITTAQTLEGITAQIASNQKDLGAALKSNAEAADTTAQGTDAIKELLLSEGIATGASAAAVASSTTSSAATKSTAAKKGKGAAAAAAAAAAKGATGATTAKGAAAAAENAKGNAAATKGNNNRRRGARVFMA
ncbi:related to gEgh 16 protein [Phialocephala subalpina]|uniref:Related to gEgh 16 protein n=1 Tax=Phialocephala subalpina TaxID=576137 RepID=A0A1L7XQR7_9HELO|nr:related to gEgh 16 protein [Phialocephala subalpina]